MLRTILAATDDSEEGRAAVVAAARLGQRSGGKVVVLTVAPSLDESARNGRLLQSLEERVEQQLTGLEIPRGRIEFALEIGLPGIEITRFAETVRADLVTVGRKRRTSIQRLMVGDTADSVARRSLVPCLFVSQVTASFGRLLVSLDGTERGTSVLPVAVEFARDAGARLRFVTVEPVLEHELDTAWDHAPRSRRLAETLSGLSQRDGGQPPVLEGLPGDVGPALAIHRGRVVDEILKEIRHSQADILAIGCHRGGPVGTLEAGSISRRLMHTCHCSVLTIPL